MPETVDSLEAGLRAHLAAAGSDGPAPTLDLLWPAFRTWCGESPDVPGGDAGRVQMEATYREHAGDGPLAPGAPGLRLFLSRRWEVTDEEQDLEEAWDVGLILHYAPEPELAALTGTELADPALRLLDESVREVELVGDWAASVESTETFAVLRGRTPATVDVYHEV